MGHLHHGRRLVDPVEGHTNAVRAPPYACILSPGAATGRYKGLQALAPLLQLSDNDSRPAWIVLLDELTDADQIDDRRLSQNHSHADELSSVRPSCFRI